MDAILMFRVLKSVKTALYIMGISMVVFLAGSVYIPKNLGFFSEINDFPLFHWLFDNRSDIDKTYWVYMQVVLMAGLSLNMTVCTIDALWERISLRIFIQKVSPHVVHAGVLLVLFGHLVSGGFGYKRDVPLHTGESVTVEDLHILVERVDLVQVKGENQKRWRIKLDIDTGDERVGAVIEPASPFFIRGKGLFAKSADENGRAVLGVVRDPGVPWEIAGAVVFLIGSMGIFRSRYFKIQV